jgi:hypothetical protein
MAGSQETTRAATVSTRTLRGNRLTGPVRHRLRAHLESGRIDEGLAALRQAWQATPMGCARRVRGAAYVAKLAELRPAEGALLEREAMALLREIAPATDALAGQSRQAGSTLLKALATTPG